MTVPDVAPSLPKAFTTELFNAWEIGKKGKDNGVLVMVSKGDRRVEIETGYGIEAILPDARVGKIIRTEMIPAFKQEDYEAGIVNGTLAVAVGIQHDIKLPDILPERLTERAATLVQDQQEAEKLRRQLAEQQEAKSIEEQERKKERRIFEQERNKRIVAEQRIRLPLYMLMSAVGAALVVIGLKNFLQDVRSQMATARVIPLDMSIVRSMEFALNPVLSLARGTLFFRLEIAWIYDALATLGFAILSAGGMGWVVVASMKAGTGIDSLTYFSAVTGVVGVQVLPRLIVTQVFTQYQIKFCRRYGIKTCSSSTSWKNLYTFVKVTALSYVIALFLDGVAMPLGGVAIPTRSGREDTDLMQWAAVISLAVSFSLTKVLWRIHRTFREEHLEQQIVCRDCNQGLIQHDLTNAEQVRAKTQNPEVINKAEAIAIAMGNIKYFAYHCLSCQPDSRPGEVYLKRHACNSEIKCPKCSQDTLET